MRTVRGNHVQQATGRRFHYWAAYEALSDSEAYFCCVVSEPSKGPFGNLERGASFDGTVAIGPDCAPVELAIRSRVLSHIEHTDFGDWRQPPPEWIGWHGPL